MAQWPSMTLEVSRKLQRIKFFPDEPPCYVRQCSLVLSIVLDFFKCLGFNMHYISLYGALSLHNCSSSGSLVFAHLGKINRIAHSTITQLTYV